MVMFPEHGIDGPARDVYDGAAVGVLGMLSALLSSQQSEGAVPAPDDRTALRTELQEALDELREAGDLPNNIRKLLSLRLHDMIIALDHLEYTGPEGVRAAAERLAASVPVDEYARTSPVVRRVAALAKEGLVVVGVTADLLGIFGGLQALGVLEAQPLPPALPARQVLELTDKPEPPRLEPRQVQPAITDGSLAPPVSPSSDAGGPYKAEPPLP